MFCVAQRIPKTVESRLQTLLKPSEQITEQITQIHRVNLNARLTSDSHFYSETVWLHANTAEWSLSQAGWLEPWRALCQWWGAVQPSALIISACKFIQEAGTCRWPRRSSSSAPFLPTSFGKKNSLTFHYSRVQGGRDTRDFKLRGSVQWCRISRGFCSPGLVTSGRSLRGWTQRT